MKSAPTHSTASSRERIVVVCTQYIGDTLLAIPFLRNLRQAHPDAVIDVCAQGGARAVLAHCPYVDDRITWSRPPRESRGGLLGAFAALRAQAGWMRARAYTRAYLLKPSMSAALLAWLAGIPVRIGFSGESSPFLTTTVRRRLGRHQVETYLDLMRAEEAAVDDGRNENWIPAESAARIRPILDQFPRERPRVFLAIQSTDVLKHWPADRWCRLTRWLVKDRGCEVFLCGGAADLAAHDALVDAMGADVARHLHDLSELVPLADAAALMQTMHLCVGVDTGLVHLAASVGVPTVVLAGPTDPNRWAPWKTPSVTLRSSRVVPSLWERARAMLGHTSHLEWPLGRADAADIPFEDVEAAVKTILPCQPFRSLDLTSGTYRYEVQCDRIADPRSPQPIDVVAE